MKAGCYLTLALLTGLILGYHEWLKRYVDPPAVWIAAAVLGMVIWFCLGAVWNAWMLGGTVRALRHLKDGVGPTDGALSAVKGEIQPYGEPLLAPMSGRPCVIYEYEISRRVTTEGKPRDIVDFSGVGMAPCLIRNDDQAVALYGFPEMDDFPSEFIGLESQAGVRKYVRQTDWENFSGLRVIRGFGQMLNALTSKGEEIRRDFRMVGPSTCHWLELSEDDRETGRRRGEYSPRVTEKRIEVGWPVIALGRYLAAAEALTTHTGTNFQRVRLLRGSVDDALKTATASRRSYLRGGLIGLVAFHLIAAGVLWLYCHSDETQSRWRRQLLDAVRNGDLPTIDRQLDRGVDINAALDTEGQTALMLAGTADVAQRLVDRGADVDAVDERQQTAVMRAAQRDLADVLDVLIAARADLDRIRPEDHSTALVQAETSGCRTAAALLRAAGARDEVVTAANGEPIDREHPAFQACVAYMAAVYRADVDGVRVLSTGPHATGLEGVDWELWRNVRPAEPQLDAGYVREEDATVELSGVTARGFHAAWVLQLRREADGWRILRERWVTE